MSVAHFLKVKDLSASRRFLDIGLGSTACQTGSSKLRWHQVGRFIRVTARTICLVRSVTAAVTSCVVTVSGVSIVSQVGEQRVDRVSIVMTNLHSWRPWPGEGFQDKEANLVNFREIRAMKTHDGVAASTWRSYEDSFTNTSRPAPGSCTPLLGADPPLVRDRVMTFPSNNGSPLLLLHTTHHTVKCPVGHSQLTSAWSPDFARTRRVVA